MKRTETNTNSLKEKEFAIAISKELTASTTINSPFVIDYVLPELCCKQADIHFGNKNWYAISFGTYLKDD